MSDTKTKEQPKSEVYGPSPVLVVLELQQELQELLNDQENYPW
jgi:hypothetical protein